MRRLQLAAVPIVLIIGVAGCGFDDPASGVAAPGAPVGRDGVAEATTIAALPAVASTTTTTQAPTPPPAVVSSTTSPAITAPPTSARPPITVPPTTEAAATTTSPVYDPEPIMGTLRSGVEGPRSLQLQRDLITLGFLPAGADDGQYGPGTAGGVRRFQASAGLVEDGVFGPNTEAALEAALAALTAPSTTITTTP